MLLESAINSGFKCAQVEEKAKTILCLWEQSYFFSPFIQILDKRGETRKLLSVTGFRKIFEADELDFGETYTIILSKSRANLTIIGALEHVDDCITMMFRCVIRVI